MNRINLLANRVANTTKSALNLGTTRVEGSTPNTGIGSKGTFSIVDRVLKMSVQKLWRVGQVKNI